MLDGATTSQRRPLGAEVALDDKAARAGFVDDVQRLAATDEFAHGLVQGREIALDAADMPDLGVARRVRHGDVDAVLVDVQPDEQGARFLAHGPTPCSLATPRQTACRVPWCSSAALAPATYGIAGVGPPDITKPSCLGRHVRLVNEQQATPAQIRTQRHICLPAMPSSPVDRRTSRTHRALQDALFNLTLSKDYESITVEELCDLANIGRSTFYEHFRGKDDLKRSWVRILDAQLAAVRSPGHGIQRQLAVAQACQGASAPYPGVGPESRARCRVRRVARLGPGACTTRAGYRRAEARSMP